MKSFTYTIRDELGIHARPAGLPCKEAKKYSCTVRVAAGGKEADATRIMALMGLCVKQGDTVSVTCEGGDEETAAKDLEAFFQGNL